MSPFRVRSFQSQVIGVSRYFYLCVYAPPPGRPAARPRPCVEERSSLFDGPTSTSDAHCLDLIGFFKDGRQALIKV